MIRKMKKDQVKKILIIGVILLLIGTTVSVTSNEIKNIDNIESMNECITCDKNMFEDVGYPPCYVMDYLPLSPEDELSPKPNTFSDCPSEFNWMTHNDRDWTTPARNQGPCGSCWAFGAVSCLECIINIAWDTPDLDVDLSEQYILSCLSASGSCGGGNSYSAFKYIKNEEKYGNYCNGIIPEDCFPYEADDSMSCSNKCPDWESKLILILDYGCWNPTYPDDIDTIKSQLINDGPVVTYFYANGDFAHWGNTHHNPDDYYSYHPHDSANHAVTIVGYKDDPSIGNGGYWIVKNSWGTDWGYNGFFNIEYGSLNIDNVQITWVKYNATPVASFAFTPSNPGSNDIIQFTDTSRVLIGGINSWRWDFGDKTISTEKDPVKSYSSIGTYPVTLTITDVSGNVDMVSRNIYIGDEVPPTTNHSLLYGTMGDNGWYTSSVGLRLKASDSFSGVDYTMYNLDSQGYRIYNNPIFFFGKTGEGEHTLSYYSVDRSGNVETEKSINFKIDKSDPVLRIIKPEEGGLYISNVKIAQELSTTVIVGPLISKFEIYDNVSGINRAEFYLDDDLVCIDNQYPYTCTISRKNFGTFSILKIIVYDNAGRSRTERAYFILFGLGLFGA